MQHSSFFQWKLKNITLLVIIGLVLSCFGFSDVNNSITNFYYYQDKPLNLDLRADKIFVKTKQQLSAEELKSSLSVYPQVSILNKFDKDEKMQFLDLNKSMNSSELIDLLSTINKNSNIEYSSPVYSPREGEGNTKVLQGVTDEILVQFKQTVSKDIIQDYLLRNNFGIVQTLDLGGGTSYVLSVPKSSGMFTLDAANMVYKSGLVNWAEPNFYYSGLLTYIPNDQFFPQQWSIRNLGNNIPDGITGTAGCDMRVDSAWNISLGIPQCIVGMVDSGIDTTHEDIKANLINSKGYDFINGHPLQTDDMNHGTCTGGIVAAVGNNTIGISGIAPNVKLIGIKIFNAAGSTTNTALTNGLIYSWQQGEWISSNSWGGGSPVSAADQAILDGVTLGRNGKGTVFCVASGNGNGPIQWPSTNPNVISVGGNSPCNQRKSPSSCDGESWWGASYGTGLYIVAPCVKVYATDRMGSVGYTSTNYFSTFNGTSSATPNTAGVCALALSFDSTMRWDSLRVRISRTADKVGSYSYTSIGPLAVLGSTWNNEMGYGKVNAYRLLQMMSPLISHTPLTNTEQTNGPRAVNCVITPANAPIVTSLTKLFVAKDAGAYDSVQLTNSGGTNWTGNIQLNGAGTYKYYIRTCDNLNKTAFAPIGAPSNFYSFVASTDVTPPVIVTTPLGNIPKGQWPATVTASVTDNIGVDSVWVKWYKNNALTGIKQFKLNFTSGTNYSAAFNSLNSDVTLNDSIFYRIFALDNSNNHNRDSSALYKFKIVSFKICENFGGGVVPPADWTVSGTYWLYSTASGYGTGTGSAEFNYYNASSGTNEYLTTLTFDPSSAGDSIKFDLAHAYYGSGYIDSLIIEASTNNGATYISLARMYAGTSFTATLCMSTVSSTSSFTPTAGEWKSRAFAIPAGTNKVHFYAKSAYGNNLYIDNICQLSTITDVTPISMTIPDEYSLSQNYPNPFNPTTKINFALPKQGFVTLKIYDVLGREVRTLVNEVKSAGQYSVDFNASEFASGVYFYKLETNGFNDVKRMMLIK
ncbi:MAG TPA: S8 family serine peptidase [Ignavibacteria bacterium]